MVIVLFSGGLDSTVLAHKAHREGKLLSLLFISYGQPTASEERAAALYVSNKLNVELINIVIPLAGLDDMRAPAGIGPRVVRGRNLALIALAANYAAAYGAAAIWYGATLDDRDYIDCSKQFFILASSLLLLDTGIILEAPLIDLSKKEVLATAEDLDVDLDRVWFCYNGINGAPCKVCNSCTAHPIQAGD